MDCQQVQDRLLQDDSAAGAVAEHVASCAGCRSLADRLASLNETWRSIPVPGAEPARERFLRRLPQEESTVRLLRPARRWTIPRWAVAAVILIAVGVAAWVLVPASQTQAAPALIERLVDWNLELARAPSPAERSQLFAANEPQLKQAVETAHLGEPERQLADLLLENGCWLATNDDPVATAERFSIVADKLVEQLQAAGTRKDLRWTQRYARLEALVAEQGVAENLQRVTEAKALDFEHQRKLEKLILRDSQRMQALVELLEQNPKLSRKEIRKALDLPRKHPRKPTPATTSEP